MTDETSGIRKGNENVEWTSKWCR